MSHLSLSIKHENNTEAGLFHRLYKDGRGELQLIVGVHLFRLETG